MLNETEINNVASRLLNAEKTREQIGILSIQYPEMTIADAYKIQSAQMKQKLDSGQKIIGWKIGLTSKVMQDALGITTPDSGIIYDDMDFSDGCTIPSDRFIQPRIEAEIAFVMKSPLDGEVSREDVIAATDFVAPCLEILDTRIKRIDAATGKARIIVDTISDNAANGGIVLGSQHHAPDKFDLRWVGCILTKNDEVVATGLGAAVLNDPVMGIVWLSKRMGQYGQRIEAGQVVLAGSFIAPIECPSNTQISADYGDFGSVNVKFA